MSSTSTEQILAYTVRDSLSVELRLNTDAQTFELSNQDGFVIRGRTEQSAPNMISLIGRLDGDLPMHDLPLFRLIVIGDTIRFDKGTQEDIDMTMGGISFNSHNPVHTGCYSHILLRCYMHENTAAAEAMTKFPAVVHLL